MKIALDAMGGDNGVASLVEGARMALDSIPELKVLLVGDPESIERRVDADAAFPKDRVEIVAASQVVEMTMSAKESLRLKDSSIAVAARLVKEGLAKGLVSAGNTAAASASTLMTWRQLPGIHRPGIAGLWPTRAKPVIFIDMGGTVDCKPRNLAHFALMGNVYARDILGIETPRVGILSVGEEQQKGNELTIETNKLLQEAKHLNFCGNAEGRDILGGQFDVVVTDGFVGNVVLKFAESLAMMMMDEFKSYVNANPLTKLLGLLIRPKARALKKKIDYAEYGGAPLLGLNGVCIICHGKSNALAISNALRVATEFVNHDVNVHIQKELELNRHILSEDNGARK